MKILKIEFIIKIDEKPEYMNLNNIFMKKYRETMKAECDSSQY